MPRKKRYTIKQLAEQCNQDLDTTLLTLWDSGFDGIKSPQDCIAGRDLERARIALGIPARKQLTSLEYWRSHFSIGVGEFADLLKEFGITVNSKAHRLPKGAVKKLKAFAARRGEPVPVVNDAPYRPSDKASEPSFELKTIGQPRPLRMLTYEEVLRIHYTLVRDFSTHGDPIDPPGARSEICWLQRFSAHTHRWEIYPNTPQWN